MSVTPMGKSIATISFVGACSCSICDVVEFIQFV